MGQQRSRVLRRSARDREHKATTYEEIAVVADKLDFNWGSTEVGGQAEVGNAGGEQDGNSDPMERAVTS